MHLYMQFLLSSTRKTMVELIWLVDVCFSHNSAQNFIQTLIATIGYLYFIGLVFYETEPSAITSFDDTRLVKVFTMS